MKTTFTVAYIAPFWRYAVVPGSACSPGIPFYRLASAIEFYERCKLELPWAETYLICKPWWGNKVDVLARYEGQPKEFPASPRARSPQE